MLAFGCTAHRKTGRRLQEGLQEGGHVDGKVCDRRARFDISSMQHHGVFQGVVPNCKQRIQRGVLAAGLAGFNLNGLNPDVPGLSLSFSRS